jgi:hypothetical protein
VAAAALPGEVAQVDLDRLRRWPGIPILSVVPGHDTLVSGPKYRWTRLDRGRKPTTWHLMLAEAAEPRMSHCSLLHVRGRPWTTSGERHNGNTCGKCLDAANSGDVEVVDV